MDFKEFDEEYSILLNFFRKEGFHKNPDVQEKKIYARLLGYRLDVEIITSRLEKEITDFEVVKSNVFHRLKSKRKIPEELAKELIWTMHMILLDISDFHIYTRIFLDTIAGSIRHSFRSAGNENWKTLESNIRVLTNEKKLEACKKRISSDFFEGVKEKVRWISGFTKSRNLLMHEHSLPRISTTRNGKLGYNIDSAKGIDWDRYSFTPILEEIQRVIANLSDLMKYLSANLPKACRSTYRNEKG